MSLTETIGSVIEQRLRYPAYRDTGIEYLPQIPSHWSIVRLRNIATLNPEVLPEDTDPSYRFRYVDIGSVSSGLDAEEVESIRFEDAPSRARRIVRQGDTYISTVRTYLRAIGFVKEDVRDLIVSTGFAVLRPGREVFPPFLFRLVDSSEFVDSVVAHSVGVGYPAISPSVLAALPVWLPPLDEQRAIAAFLDRETAQIDALIAKKERLIALLQEKRTALISHAVTKGLDPTAPTRDSGIPWIGQIPASWGIALFRRIVKSMCDGPFGSSMKSSDYSDEGVRLIRLQNIGLGRFDDRDKAYISEEHFRSLPGHDAAPGDVLVAGLGDANHPVGRACQLPCSISQAMVKADCFRVRLDESLVRHDFAVHYLCSQAARAEVAQQMRGATRDRINLSGLASLMIPVPPAQDQIDIANRLQQSSQQIDALTERVRLHIKLLSEHRAALISAAVTGKIDVRGEVA